MRIHRAGAERQDPRRPAAALLPAARRRVAREERPALPERPDRITAPAQQGLAPRRLRALDPPVPVRRAQVALARRAPAPQVLAGLVLGPPAPVRLVHRALEALRLLGRVARASKSIVRSQTGRDGLQPSWPFFCAMGHIEIF